MNTEYSYLITSSYKTSIVLIADTGCSFPLFGKHVLPFMYGVTSYKTEFSTAGGTRIAQQLCTIKGQVLTLNKKILTIEIRGALLPDLNHNLIPVQEGFFGTRNSWVKISSCSEKLKITRTNNQSIIKFEPIKPDDIGIKQEVFLSNTNDETGTVVEAFERWGYLPLSSIGEKLKGELITQALYVVARDMHRRLFHVGVESIQKTFVEHGVKVSKSLIENAIKGCRICPLKAGVLKKLSLLPQRGNNPTNNVVNKIASEAAEAVEADPIEVQKETAQLVKRSKQSSERIDLNINRNYQGIGWHPNHAIMQDVSYMPVEGVHNAKGITVIIDLKTKLVEARIVFNRAIINESKKTDNLTTETTAALTSWCSKRGIPSIIKTDNGPEFQGIYERFCKERAIDHHFGAPYTPQQQGLVERFNGTMKKLMGIVLKVFNWPEDHWPYIIQSVIEVYNNIATGTHGVSPHKAWYGVAPTLRLIPGDRVTVNLRYYPAAKMEEFQKFGDVIYCTYLHREGANTRVALMTEDRGITVFYVPLKALRPVWHTIFSAAKEAAEIFREPRGIDKTMKILQDEQINITAIEGVMWDDPMSPDVVLPDGKIKMNTNLTENAVCRVEEAVRRLEKSMLPQRGNKDYENHNKQFEQPSNLIYESFKQKYPHIMVVDNNMMGQIKGVRPFKSLQAMAANIIISKMENLGGKTHEDVSPEEISAGTHDNAMTKELAQFEKNKVLGVKLNIKTAKDDGIKIISSRWVHSWKMKSLVERVAKSRLVIRGFMDKESVPVYVEIPTGKFRRLAFIVGLSLGKEAHLVDVKTAFLQAPLPENRKIAVKMPTHLPKSSKLEPGSIFMLNKAMYGLQDSPRIFCEWLKEKLEQLKWTCIGWGCFIRNDKHQSIDIIVAYIDDAWIWSNDGLKIYNEIAHHVQLDDIQKIGKSWIKYIGNDVRKLDDGIIEVSIKTYTDGLEVPEGTKGYIKDSEFPIKPADLNEIDMNIQHEMQVIVGKLGYIAGNHPGTTYLFAELSRHTAKPCKRILNLAYRVAACFKCQSPVPLLYYGVREEGELRVWTDASLRRMGLAGVGRNGYIIQYVNKSECLEFRGNYIHWGSVADKRKHPSTSSAEISAMILGLKESVDICRALSKMLKKEIYLKVFTDANVVCNQLDIGKAVTNPFDQSNVEYVLQCLKDFKQFGVKQTPLVVHVTTGKQKADCLTKYIKNVWVNAEAFMAKTKTK